MAHGAASTAVLREWAVKDSNLRSLLTTDLQSVPFGHLGNRPVHCIRVFLHPSRCEARNPCD